MAVKIDLDRGVIIRINATLGMDVFMYLDDPGVYLNAYGKPVPQTIALGAGFDIARWGKLRQKKLAMAKFKAEIDAADLIDAEATGREVIVSRSGYSLVGLTLGRAMIEGPDGERLGEVIALEMATKLFDEMFPPELDESAYETEIREGLNEAKEAVKAPPSVVKTVETRNARRG